ncbi:MAG: SDR family NAD(P)-dependent oxidoreductase [Geodermatophilaceae bacterium]
MSSQRRTSLGFPNSWTRQALMVTAATVTDRSTGGPDLDAHRTRRLVSMIASADLAGCVALVTGASSGIGAATARALAAEGATVALSARRLTGSRTWPGDPGIRWYRADHRGRCDRALRSRVGGAVHGV